MSSPSASARQAGANRWALTSGGTDYTTTPGSADVATFDGGGTASCTITANIDV